MRQSGHSSSVSIPSDSSKKATRAALFQRFRLEPGTYPGTRRPRLGGCIHTLRRGDQLMQQTTRGPQEPDGPPPQAHGWPLRQANTLGGTDRRSRDGPKGYEGRPRPVWSLRGAQAARRRPPHSAEDSETTSRSTWSPKRNNLRREQGPRWTIWLGRNRKPPMTLARPSRQRSMMRPRKPACSVRAPRPPRPGSRVYSVLNLQNAVGQKGYDRRMADITKKIEAAADEAQRLESLPIRRRR